MKKYRQNVFTQELLQRLEHDFSEKCSEIECSLVEFHDEEDEVHLLVFYPVKLSISSIVNVNVLKGVPARRLRKKFSAANKK